MSEILSLSEQRGSEAIQDQTDYQLLYTFNQFNDQSDFDFVDYICIPAGGIAFPVSKKFFISAVLEELVFRELI